ncbi:MAG TPA: serine/threonine-protein kinase [Gemmatales bacterium]|nr:serine/threonine-protein kinase [Gemmatales bacterium]
MASEQTIGGYRLMKHMTTGQTSQVWEVNEPGSGRHFAMKLLLPEFTKDPLHRKMLEHEAKVGLPLSHPNVIKMLKLAKDKDTQYLIMEFFPGGNIKLRMMRKHTIVHERCHSILTQAAAGIAHMHDRGWIHRDIKPDNILLNSSGEIKLIDFALAKRIERGGAGFFGLFRGGKKAGKTAGTRSYMSPEQILNRPLDERADIYSFGATMYEIACGKAPFVGATPNDLLYKHLSEKPKALHINYPSITEEFSQLCLRCLAKDKKERPRNMHELLSQLRTTRVFTGDKLERPA